MSMSRELRDRWATALEDPSRVQGSTQLCKVDDDGTRRQCCLDVLIELYNDDHPQGSEGALVIENRDGGMHYGWLVPDHADPNEGATRLVEESSYLPTPVARWAQVDSNPYIGDVYAVTRNDSKGQSFAEIAAALRDEDNEVA